MFTIPNEAIFYINVGILVFYVLMFFFGYRKGFLYQILITIGSLVAFFASWRYAPVFAARFHVVNEGMVPKELSLFKSVIATYANELLWYFILFFALKFVFGILTRIVQKIRRVPVIKQVSGLLGGLLGLLTATVWILVVCVFLNTSIIKNGVEIKEKSWLGQIQNSASVAISSFALPEEDSKPFAKLVQNFENLDENDKKALDKWLSSHGFESIEDNEIEQ
ncbi:MAG: CvpA family protein [Solobacterium sp.]|nr:CvpA family protein [Solobacterium sp.]